jgi:hypothetical protein
MPKVQSLMHEMQTIGVKMLVSINAIQTLTRCAQQSKMKARDT